jgi:methylated-DNA-protein-cysteine methyltransferase-like protein
VARVVKSIPKGHVSSYSQVAARAGQPRRARAVVRALKKLSGVPWWRVIRADGTIAPEMVGEQDRRLRAEGVSLQGRRIMGALAPARRTE